LKTLWGKVLSTHPGRPRGRHFLLYNGYQVSFPGVKRPERGVDRALTASIKADYGQSYTST
jgi:hypothetical protein